MKSECELGHKNIKHSVCMSNIIIIIFLFAQEKYDNFFLCCFFLYCLRFIGELKIIKDYQ